MYSGHSCAKFILSGEHAVLHGSSALSFPLPHLSLEYKEVPGSEVLTLNGKLMEDVFYSRIKKLRELYQIKTPLQKIEITSNIPMGSGLGSSAALCHAVLKAHSISPLSEVLRLCHSGEKLFHGKSSGLDPYSVVLEKPILFHSDLSYQLLNLNTFLESQLQFVLIDTKIEHDTKKSIQQQSSLRERSPEEWKECMSMLAKLSSEMKNALEHECTQIGPLMNSIHHQLCLLGVSHPSIEKLSQKMKKLGALGTKLTGAGQGGFVLGLFPQKTVAELCWEEQFPGQSVLFPDYSKS